MATFEGLRMAPRKRNRYNAEFKKRAVLHHVENQTTLADCATKFGITPGMLSKWIERYSPKQNGASGTAMNYQLEINRLKDEMSTLKKIVSQALLQKHSADTIVESMVEQPDSLLLQNRTHSKQR